MTHLQLFKNPEFDVEIGIDEAGRGPMFGRLYVAAVVLPRDGSFFHKDIKDSKKIKSVKKMKECFDYIIQNSVYYAIHFVEHDVIDKINIRQAVFQGMHACIKDIYDRMESPSKLQLLIDGNDFKPYVFFDETRQNIVTLPYETVEGGDNTYMSIAAASILAKVSHDKYIEEMCKKNPLLEEFYGLSSNMGYGTKIHMNGIKRYGISPWHRKSFSPCKNLKINIKFKNKY